MSKKIIEILKKIKTCFYLCTIIMVFIIVGLPDLVSFINVERFLEKDYDMLKKKALYECNRTAAIELFNKFAIMKNESEARFWYKVVKKIEKGECKKIDRDL